MKDHKKAWRRKVNQHLAEAFGGKCTICGYDKEISAFDYHHVDPKSKKMLVSAAISSGLAWATIIEEARKCTMICCRCHRELHAGVVELPKNYAKFNEDYADAIKLKEIEYDKCVCGNEKNKQHKFCSIACFSKSQRRFQVDKDVLQALIAENTYEDVGRMFNVTGRSIKDRCKFYGIELKPRRMRT